VRECAAWDPELAREVARAAQLVKGYGDVRRRMLAGLDALLDTVLAAARREAAAGAGFPLASRLASLYRTLVLEGPESEARARALATEVSARLERGEYEAAREGLIEVGGPDMAPHPPQRSEAPRDTRGAPRSPSAS